jgi:HSP20 family protein
VLFNYCLTSKTIAMSIVRWQPAFSPNLRSWVEDFFSDLKLFPGDGASMAPAINIRETEEMFVVEVAAPGKQKEDFNIEVKDGVLMISSEQKAEKEEKTEHFTRREFSYNKFSRSFTLPENVDQDKIKANYKDGLLMIDLPKMEKTSPKVKKVTIA